MFTLSGSTGGHGGDAKTIISPNTSFGDIINIADLVGSRFEYILPKITCLASGKPHLGIIGPNSYTKCITVKVIYNDNNDLS